jgi:hypothetical protein
MATRVDTIVIPWLCVRPPKYGAEVSPLEARRMLAMLEELHQPVLPHQEKNPDAAWCMVLEVVVLHRERSRVELIPFGIL